MLKWLNAGELVIGAEDKAVVASDRSAALSGECVELAAVVVMVVAFTGLG